MTTVGYTLKIEGSLSPQNQLEAFLTEGSRPDYHTVRVPAHEVSEEFRRAFYGAWVEQEGGEPGARWKALRESTLTLEASIPTLEAWREFCTLEDAEQIERFGAALLAGAITPSHALHVTRMNVKIALYDECLQHFSDECNNARDALARGINSALARTTEYRQALKDADDEDSRAILRACKAGCHDAILVFERLLDGLA